MNLLESSTPMSGCKRDTAEAKRLGLRDVPGYCATMLKVMATASRGRRGMPRQPRRVQRHRRGMMIHRNKERLAAAQGDAKFAQVVERYPMISADRKNPQYIAMAQPRNAQQLLARGAIHIEREKFTMPQRPTELWINMLIEVGRVRGRQFVGCEAVVPHQPSRFVQAMLAYQGRSGDR